MEGGSVKLRNNTQIESTGLKSGRLRNRMSWVWRGFWWYYSEVDSKLVKQLFPESTIKQLCVRESVYWMEYHRAQFLFYWEKVYSAKVECTWKHHETFILDCCTVVVIKANTTLCSYFILVDRDQWLTAESWGLCGFCSIVFGLIPVLWKAFKLEMQRMEPGPLCMQGMGSITEQLPLWMGSHGMEPFLIGCIMLCAC